MSNFVVKIFLIGYVVDLLYIFEMWIIIEKSKKFIKLYKNKTNSKEFLTSLLIINNLLISKHWFLIKVDF